MYFKANLYQARGIENLDRMINERMYFQSQKAKKNLF